MLDSHKIEDFLLTHCTKVTRKHNGWIMRCPFCGDSKKNPNKKRFHLDYYKTANEYTYTCYNGGCNVTGDIFSLYSYIMGVTYAQARKELEDSKYDSLSIKNKITKKEEQPITDTPALQELDLSDMGLLGVDSTPEGRIEKRLVQKLKDFVKSRKISFECFVATRGKFQNRIIIPLEIEGKIVYFQARRIIETIEPKYLNPTIDKSNIILNIDKWDPDKDVIVTEGLLDAMTIGIQGTTCLGAAINDEFIKNILDNLNKGKLIIATDNDEAGKNTVKKILGIQIDKEIPKPSKYMKQLYFFKMPFDDIKDLNQLFVEKNTKDIYNFVKENSYGYFKTRVSIS